jgi:hypothetical protein
LTACLCDPTSCFRRAGQRGTTITRTVSLPQRRVNSRQHPKSRALHENVVVKEASAAQRRPQHLPQVQQVASHTGHSIDVTSASGHDTLQHCTEEGKQAAALVFGFRHAANHAVEHAPVNSNFKPALDSSAGRGLLASGDTCGHHPSSSTNRAQREHALRVTEAGSEVEHRASTVGCVAQHDVNDDATGEATGEATAAATVPRSFCFCRDGGCSGMRQHRIKPRAVA